MLFTSSPSKLEAPMRNSFGVSHSGPNSVYTRTNQLTASLAVFMPPAGFRPTCGTKMVVYIMYSD